MVRELRFTPGLLVAVLAATVSMADARMDADGAALVDTFVNDIVTFSGHFEQTLLDANGDRLETSSGRLDVRRPGQLRWVYDEPYEQWLVADGLNIWSYDVDLAQVTVKPQEEALANTPALLLGGADDAMDEFVIEQTALQEEPDGPATTWVRLRPIDADNGFRHVDLGFVDATLRRMVFVDNLEQTTIVTLDDVVIDQPIDPAVFRFVAPEDVDVVGTPAVADDS